MPIFSYEAMTNSGKMVHGEMESLDSQRVLDHLRSQGYFPVSAEEKTAKRAKFSKLFERQTIPLRDLALLTRELAAMLRAGLTIEQSLSLLLEMSGDPRLRDFLQRVLGRIRSGSTFYESLTVENDVLPNIYAALVKAGDAGGGKTLESALERLADYLEKSGRLREAIVSSMVYPVVLLFTAFLSIVLLLIYVIPRFEPMFQSNPEAMPFSMKVVASSSHLISDYGLVAIIVVTGAAYMLRRALRSEAFAERYDAILLKWGKIGPLISKIETARFSRTLAALHANGIAIAAALPLAAESASNRVFRKSLMAIVSRVREGKALSNEFLKEDVFPPVAVQIFRIGEETGRLDAMLINAAEVCEHDVEKQVTRMMTLLTPAITIALGVIIGGIIATVLSAILSINDIVG